VDVFAISPTHPDLGRSHPLDLEIEFNTVLLVRIGLDSPDWIVAPESLEIRTDCLEPLGYLDADRKPVARFAGVVNALVFNFSRLRLPGLMLFDAFGIDAPAHASIATRGLV